MKAILVIFHTATCQIIKLMMVILPSNILNLVDISTLFDDIIDSKTNTFTYSTDISGSNLSYKPISDSYKTRTKRYVAKNDFLSLKLITLLKKRIIQSLLYSLVIAIDDKTH